MAGSAAESARARDRLRKRAATTVAAWSIIAALAILGALWLRIRKNNKIAKHTSIKERKLPKPILHHALDDPRCERGSACAREDRRQRACLRNNHCGRSSNWNLGSKPSAQRDHARMLRSTHYWKCWPILAGCHGLTAMKSQIVCSDPAETAAADQKASELRNSPRSAAGLTQKP